MARHHIVTLLTDFGLRDPYVAAMKGAILQVCPQAQIIDLCHEIPPQDVLAGGFVLAQAAPHFPPGTLHVAVVDPGVGTQRPILAARAGGQLVLLPDNGLITFLVQALPLEGVFIVQKTPPSPRPAPSATFHGRDVFAPLAGHILNGLEISRLGPQPATYKMLDLPGLLEHPDSLVGEVIYVDHFGNLVSNLSRQEVLARRPDLAEAHVFCDGRDLGPLKATYAEASPGEPLGLFNSMNLLEVAVNGGSAAEMLRAAIGTEIRLQT